MLYHLSTAPHICGHYGQAHGRGFHGGTREALSVRRQHVNIHASVKACHVFAGAEKSHPDVFGRRSLRGSDRTGLIGIVGADDANPKVRVGCLQSPGGFEHVEIALLVHEAPHQTNHDIVGAQCSHFHPGRGRVLNSDRCPVEAGEIDAVAQH